MTKRKKKANTNNHLFKQYLTYQKSWTHTIARMRRIAVTGNAISVDNREGHRTSNIF